MSLSYCCFSCTNTFLLFCFSFRNYNWFWVPIVGPHIGALLGAHLYQIFVGLHWPDVDDVTPEAELEPIRKRLIGKRA